MESVFVITVVVAQEKACEDRILDDLEGKGGRSSAGNNPVVSGPEHQTMQLTEARDS
jgi:hypothetical protein